MLISFDKLRHSILNSQSLHLFNLFIRLDLDYAFSRRSKIHSNNISQFTKLTNYFYHFSNHPMSISSKSYVINPIKKLYNDDKKTYMNAIQFKSIQINSSQVNNQMKSSLLSNKIKKTKNLELQSLENKKEMIKMKIKIDDDFKKKQERNKNENKFAENNILLIDGSAVVFRSYFSVASKIHFKNKTEMEETQDFEFVTFSAFKYIITLLELMPSHVVVCFDFRGFNFRHELYPLYKKNRKITPHLVFESINFLRSLILAMGISVLEIPGVEADDVIATLTKNALSTNMHVNIASSDKDFFQLLSPKVTLLRNGQKGSEIIYFGMEDFSKKFSNLKPHQFVDVLSLMGDLTDNVKGVKGIGKEGAILLINEFESLENLFLNVENVSSARYKNALIKGKEDALLTRRLVKLQSELPNSMVNCDWNKHVFQSPKTEDPFWGLLSLSKSTSLSLFQIKSRIKTLWEELNDKN